MPRRSAGLAVAVEEAAVTLGPTGVGRLPSDSSSGVVMEHGEHVRTPSTIRVSRTSPHTSHLRPTKTSADRSGRSAVRTARRSWTSWRSTKLPSSARWTRSQATSSWSSGTSRSRRRFGSSNGWRDRIPQSTPGSPSPRTPATSTIRHSFRTDPARGTSKRSTTPRMAILTDPTAVFKGANGTFARRSGRNTCGPTPIDGTGGSLSPTPRPATPRAAGRAGG